MAGGDVAGGEVAGGDVAGGDCGLEGPAEGDSPAAVFDLGLVVVVTAAPTEPGSEVSDALVPGARIAGGPNPALA